MRQVSLNTFPAILQQVAPCLTTYAVHFFKLGIQHVLQSLCLHLRSCLVICQPNIGLRWSPDPRARDRQTFILLLIVRQRCTLAYSLVTCNMVRPCLHCCLFSGVGLYALYSCLIAEPSQCNETKLAAVPDLLGCALMWPQFVLQAQSVSIATSPPTGLHLTSADHTHAWLWDHLC